MVDDSFYRFVSGQRLCDVCKAFEIPFKGVKCVDLSDTYPALPRLTQHSHSCDLCSLLLQTVRSADRLRPSFSWFHGNSYESLRLIFTTKRTSLLGFRPTIAGTIQIQPIDSSEGRPLPVPDSAEAKLPFESVSSTRGSLSDGVFRQVVEPRVVKQAHKFLSRCTTQHNSAIDHRVTRWRPTRLLHIADIDNLNLNVDQGNFVKYAALSYRWGAPPFPHNTTSDNLRDRVNRIPLEGLPQTIKDAIYLAKKIGIEFVWIDSLCIIQNDADDWKQEASQMHMVYRSAWVVIAALEQQTVTETFLETSNPSTMNLKVKHHNQDARLEHTLRFKFDPYNEYEYTAPTLGRLVSTSTWATRGWMMQEQLLSNRILYFAIGMVIFECPRCIWYGDDRHRIKKNHTSSDRWTRNYLGIGRDFDIGFQILEPYEQWYEMLKTYTNRTLTYGKDKLPAIEGLAQQIMSSLSLKDRYIWGLWMDDLRRGLLWCTSNKMGPRLGRCEAPSWSWVATETPIYYGDWLFDKRIEYIATVHDTSLTHSSPSGPDTTSAHSLTIRGRLVQLEGMQWRPISSGIFEGGRGMSLYFDEQATVPDAQILLLPLLISQSKVEGRLAQALILEKQNELQRGLVVHRRIGTACLVVDMFSLIKEDMIHLI